jgi:recombinational DNA repair protein (RecF pathway)
MSELQTTEMLILRKTPYRESSLIVAGITPGNGRLDLVVKGELAFSKKKFPVIDLFREIQVEFARSPQSTLHNLRQAEVVADCGIELAAVPDNFLLASELAELILKTTRPELPCPETFDAALNVLNMLSQIAGDDPQAAAKRARCAAMMKLVILSENGLLPEDLDPDPDANVEKHDLLDHILAAAQGLDDPPVNTGSFWTRMSRWSDQLMTKTELRE